MVAMIVEPKIFDTRFWSPDAHHRSTSLFLIHFLSASFEIRFPANITIKMCSHPLRIKEKSQVLQGERLLPALAFDIQGRGFEPSSITFLPFSSHQLGSAILL